VIAPLDPLLIIFKTPLLLFCIPPSLPAVLVEELDHGLSGFPSAARKIGPALCLGSLAALVMRTTPATVLVPDEDWYT
jgi:hypothetical protein